MRTASAAPKVAPTKRPCLVAFNADRFAFSNEDSYGKMSVPFVPINIDSANLSLSLKRKSRARTASAAPEVAPTIDIRGGRGLATRIAHVIFPLNKCTCVGICLICIRASPDRPTKWPLYYQHVSIIAIFKANDDSLECLECLECRLREHLIECKRVNPWWKEIASL